MPVYTVAEYVQRFNEIEAYLEETLKRAETTYDDCFDGCNVAFPPPDTSAERQRCVDGCEKTRRDGEFAARTAALEAHNELDDEARYTGLIPSPDVMIIIDRDLKYLLRDIKKESPWNNAAVVPVDSLFGLKEALRADRVVRSLLLVTYVEGGEISIGFELVSLAYLRQLSPLMRVNAYLELRGPTDGLGPGATEVKLFREALGAEESGARYQFGGVSLTVSVDGSDKNTRELSSRDPLSPYRHFVTVVGKGTEPVRLVASIDGVVTDEIKRALTWNATGGRIQAPEEQPAESNDQPDGSKTGGRARESQGDSGPDDHRVGSSGVTSRRSAQALRRLTGSRSAYKVADGIGVSSTGRRHASTGSRRSIRPRSSPMQTVHF